MRSPRVSAVALALGLAGLLASCTSTPPSTTGSPSPGRSIFSSGTPQAGPRYTLRVLASSEVTDMAPVLGQAAKATGVTVLLTPASTLAATAAIAGGQAGSRYDAAWLSTNRYLTMTPGGLARILDATAIMSSPVIVGVRASVARRLGWDRQGVTWSDIAAAAAARQFSFGMDDPASTNSGLSALVGVATAVAGDGGALHGAEVTQASPKLRELFAGQALKASSSAALISGYLRAQGSGDAQGSPVDGLIDYESGLATLNASGKLREPLTLIYPANGVVTATYPLSLLAAAPPPARAAYQRLVRYLLRPAVQQQVMSLTHRRPAVSQVPLDPRLPRRLVFELPFPATLRVLDDLINSYYGTLRRPARTVFVIDISQAMAGSPLAALKAALGALTGATASPATAFQTREQITFQPFATAAYPPVTFDIPPRDPQHERDLINAYIAAQAAGGGSAIYDGLTAAYHLIISQAAADPDRITTMVLLTVGRVTTGSDLAAFTLFYRALPPAAASVPVFPVIFGPPGIRGTPGTAQMGQLAGLTGGQVFTASRLPLATILTLIRENQLPGDCYFNPDPLPSRQTPE
jgi:Ca-activated chloride channel family protein